MGWDAFSSAKTHWGYTGKNNFVLVMEDKEHFDAFKNAVKKVKAITGGTADGYLNRGSLDARQCGEMLQKATGESCMRSLDNSEIVWGKRMVKSMAKKADWNFKFGKDDTCAYWSAKVFLETCAELGLSITFVW